MAFDSKKQNLRLLPQMKKPRWWPKVSAAKREPVLPTDIAAKMAEEIKTRSGREGKPRP